MNKVLVIDDDRSVIHLIQSALRNEPEVEVVAASSAEQGIARVADGGIDAVLLDVMLPDLSGLDAYKQLRQHDAKMPVIFITVGGTSDTAIEAMKLGAFDYLLKPLDLERVRELVRQALEMRRLMRDPVAMQNKDEAPTGGDSLVGRTPQIQEVYKAIGRVAPQNVTVLVRGESGTGKELVARAIYHHSSRADGPFLAVNCAALTETLLESELFGHEKGSFTGATSQRIGKFEQCTGGTLFMDEVGDMSPVMQSKVLRVLQEQQFERVEGTQAIKTDVRIIAATNRDLDDMVAKSTFREDLYYRLNGFTIKIPPLRDRKADIALLLDWFLARYRKELGKDVQGFSPEALELMLSYAWPGNVRQLQSVLKQAIVQATSPVLMAELLPPEIRAPHSAAMESTEVRQADDLPALISDRLKAGSRNLYSEALEAMERTLLTAVLRNKDGNQSKASEILGITRGSLRNKIRQLGILIDHTINLQDAPAEAEPSEV